MPNVIFFMLPPPQLENKSKERQKRGCGRGRYFEPPYLETKCRWDLAEDVCRSGWASDEPTPTPEPTINMSHILSMTRHLSSARLRL